MPRKYIPVEVEQTVVKRAANCCEYCLSRADYATESKFAVEHIVPLSRGGTDELGNLAYCCSGCNGHKYNKVEAPDPTDGKLVPLYNPRTQKWDEHFGWRNGYTQMLGLTPTGRATVATLHTNRLGLMNMRRVLYLSGEHPPNPKSE